MYSDDANSLFGRILYFESVQVFYTPVFYTYTKGYSTKHNASSSTYLDHCGM